MLTLKTLSPENGVVGIGRWVPAPSRQQSLTRERRVSGNAPGSKVASSLTMRLRGNQGEPTVGADGSAYPRTSLTSEEEGGGCRKSGVPIRAMKPGNAGGAKGHRFEATGKGDMARH
jgi:hypothetical protein